MIFNRIPTDRINWVTSSFLIGTFLLTLTAVPAYLWFFGISWFQVALFLVMFFACGHEHHARLSPAVFAHDLQGQLAGQALYAALRRGGV